MLDRREPEGRDAFNDEAPPEELLAASDLGETATTSLPDNVVVAMTVEQEAEFNIALLKKHRAKAIWPSDVTRDLMKICLHKIDHNLMIPGAPRKDDPILEKIAKELFLSTKEAYTKEQCWNKLKNLKEDFWKRMKKLQQQNFNEEDELKARIFGVLHDKELEMTRICKEEDKDLVIFELKEENDSLKEQVKLAFEAKKEALRVEEENKFLKEKVKLESETKMMALRLYNEEKKKVAYLQNEIKKAEKLRSVMHNQILELKGNLRVFCRVRPMPEANATYPKEGEFVGRRVEIKIPGCKVSFTCDHVFEEGSSQQTIFEEISELVQSALDGRKVCIFAYGQTGSGKTYTMTGGSGDDEKGVIPRAMDKIFETIKSRNTWGGNMYSVKVSIVEIYKNEIRDLLSGKSCSVRHAGGCQIESLESCIVQTATEATTILEKALNKRMVAETFLNAKSSRSHLLFKLMISSKPQNGQEMKKFEGVLSLIDLAGSERHEKSGATEGERFDECISINRSLNSLGNVFEAIKEKKEHIPYRDSELTKVLESCLGKDSKVLMFINVSPEEASFQETSAAFGFAERISFCSKKVVYDTIRFKANTKTMEMKKQREIESKTPDHSRVRHEKGALLMTTRSCMSTRGKGLKKRKMADND